MNSLLNNICLFEILHDWSIISVSGTDSKQYLHNQTTVNVCDLKNNFHILCANCNPNGRVQGILRLFLHQDKYFYIQRSCIVESQIQNFKKYAIFSDVCFQNLNDYVFIGLMGCNIKKKLSFIFSELPDSTQSMKYIKNFFILFFIDPVERFLLIIKKKQLNKMIEIFLKNNFLQVSSYWLFLDLQAGFPILENNMINNFFPNEMNLNIFHGIDFQKGCYCGQEVISKLYHKNINNKNMYHLIGTTSFEAINKLPMIEMYSKKQWKKVGKILCFLHIQDNIFFIQCILKNKNIVNNFRLSTDYNSNFFITNNL